MRGAGCYAESGPLAIHWRAVSNGTRGGDWQALCDTVAQFPAGQIWRHNQAGDLPHINGDIDAPMLAQLAAANTGKMGFTYTHHAPTTRNLAAIESANRAGFAVNLSANDLTHADRLADVGAGPVVTILPADATENTRTPAGRTVVICPAVTGRAESCATCKLCARIDRKTIVGFPAHGTGKNKVSIIAVG
jgi:hypothetical protein